MAETRCGQPGSVSNRPFAALKDRPNERAGSVRERSSAEGLAARLRTLAGINGNSSTRSERKPSAIVFRGVRGGLAAALQGPEHAQEARRAWDGDVVDVGRAQARYAHMTS
jgi:hypothetical protein